MQFNRTLKIENRAAGDSRVIEMAISSETPYQRFWGIEILCHDPSCVDLSRLSGNDHPLLINHCTEDQIGVILDPVVGADRVLRCKAKFSRASDAEEIFQDVQDGIRQLVSIGYFIDEIHEVVPVPETETEPASWSSLRMMTGDQFEAEMRAKHGENFTRSRAGARAADSSTLPTYLVTRFTIFEVSIVPIPADPTVGVGRSAGVETAPQAPAAPQPQIIVMEKSQMSEAQKTPAELEIERRDAIAALADAYAKYLKPNDAREAINGKISVEQFREIVMARMESKYTDTSQAIGLSAKEIERYSLGRALLASITGDWSKAGLELAVSRAVAEKIGVTPEGFFPAPEIFNRDFNVGTASEAGNLVQTGFRGDLFTDVLRNNMALGGLGCTFLTGLSSNVDIPRKITASTLGMLTEIGSASETAPATAKATLSPKRIGAYVQVSKQALIQSALALENMIRDDLVMGAAVLLENQCINGAGTGAEIKGLRNVTGIGTVVGGTNGLAPAWSHLVDLESACANANAEPDRLSGYLTNTKVRGKYKQTQFATNLPMIWQNGAQPLNGYKVAVTNNVPSNITKGTSTTVCSATLFGSDWSNAVIGLFGAPDITVDPYSLAATGQVQITLNQFADLAHRQPATMAKIDDLLA